MMLLLTCLVASLVCHTSSTGLSFQSDDLKLATLDPQLYKLVKDPVVKKFTFELEDAVTVKPYPSFNRLIQAPTKVPKNPVNQLSRFHHAPNNFVPRSRVDELKTNYVPRDINTLKGGPTTKTPKFEVDHRRKKFRDWRQKKLLEIKKIDSQISKISENLNVLQAQPKKPNSGPFWHHANLDRMDTGETTTTTTAKPQTQQPFSSWFGFDTLASKLRGALDPFFGPQDPEDTQESESQQVSSGRFIPYFTILPNSFYNKRPMQSFQKHPGMPQHDHTRAFQEPQKRPFHEPKLAAFQEPKRPFHEPKLAAFQEPKRPFQEPKRPFHDPNADLESFDNFSLDYAPYQPKNSIPNNAQSSPNYPQGNPNSPPMFQIHKQDNSNYHPKYIPMALEKHTLTTEKVPVDRGVKTRLYTKVTDVTTTGGDEPTRAAFVVDEDPAAIFDEDDIQLAPWRPYGEEEDQIEEDISRQDYEHEPQPSSYPGYFPRPTQPPQYYPDLSHEQQTPFRRAPDYGPKYPSSEPYGSSRHPGSSGPGYPGPSGPGYPPRSSGYGHEPQYPSGNDFGIPLPMDDYKPAKGRNSGYRKPRPSPEPQELEPPYPTPSDFGMPSSPPKDQRHMIPAYRKRLKEAYNPEPEDESLDLNFHEDRKRNLQNFFQDKEEHPVLFGEFNEEDEDARIIPPPIGMAKENKETDNEESDDEYSHNHDPFEFPSSYYSLPEQKDSNYGYAMAGDSNWDNFFDGHADNVEKDIHTLSRQSADHTAPPENYQEENNQEGTEDYPTQNPNYDEFEQVPEVPNYREQDDNNHDEQQAHQPDQSSPQYDYYEEDYPQGEEGHQSLREDRQHIQEYEEYPSNDYDQEYPEGRQSEDNSNRFANKGYDDFYHSDGDQGDFFGPNFEDFFKKLETGIEDEITTSPNYDQKQAKHEEQTDYDEVTNNDLNPENYDNNHPDTLEFRMPSHDELQKNYKTVSTSASNQVEHIVQFQPNNTKRRRIVRLTSKH